MTPPHLTEHPAASQQAIVDAALLMLRQMGLSPDDLVTAPPGGRHSPCRNRRRQRGVLGRTWRPFGWHLGHAEPCVERSRSRCCLPRSAPWG